MENYEKNYDDFTLRDINEEELSGSLSPFTFLCITIALAMFGLICAYSASYDTALREGNPHYYYLLEMTLYLILGIVTGIILFFLPRRRLERLHWVLFPLSMLLLLFNAVTDYFKIGTFSFPGNPFFRTSDFVIFASILQIASVFPKIREKERRGWAYLGVFVSSLATVFLMTLCGSYSYAALYILVLAVCFNASRLEKAHIAVFILYLFSFMIVLALASPALLEQMFSRLMPFLSNNRTAVTLSSSISAIAEGGFFGKGIGAGYYKLGHLDAVHTDYIFANMAEELGLVGVLMIMLLFLLFLYLGIRCARRAEKNSDDFIKIATMGFSFAIVAKAAMSMLVASGVLFTTGISLPFFSANPLEYFITVLECTLLYRFMHITGRGYEKARD